jgi:lipid II:glycine glycyltransferase (peptidoglycan interpeptide bridge formation enzyme)
MFYTYKEICDLKKLKSLAKAENAIFTLIESYEKIENSTKNPLKKIIPRFTLVLDLEKSEQQILEEMHPKGRYNIKLAEKKGIQIKEENDVTDFYNILEQTAKRDGFNINKKNTYQALIDTLKPKNKAKLYMAYHSGKPVAGVIILFLENTAIYFYGASANEYRELMAPYLLQWTAIQEAKKRGLKYYDFLGIADPNNPKDQLAGVTEFKRKFGGENIRSWPKSKTIIHRPLLYLLLKIKNTATRI